MNLKLIEWNIHLKSDNSKIVPNFVSETLCEYNPDIIVLCEFVLCQNWEEFTGIMSDYSIIFSVDSKNKNGILIATKKKYPILSIVRDEEAFNCKETPNFLQLTISCEERPVTIIGTRIRIDNGDEKDIESRNKQMNNLIQHLKSIKRSPVIACGDLNNGAYKRENWNYSLFKEWLGGDFKIHTPCHGIKEAFEGGITDNFSFKGGNKYKEGFAEAHVISSKNLDIEVDYSWEFRKKDKIIFANIYGNGDNFENIPAGFPDHAILIADINTRV